MVEWWWLIVVGVSVAFTIGLGIGWIEFNHGQWVQKKIIAEILENKISEIGLNKSIGLTD